MLVRRISGFTINKSKEENIMSKTTNSAAQPKETPKQEAQPMQMNMKIHALRTDGSVLANASVTLNGCFAIRGIRVVNSESGPFISVPRYRTGDGYKDVCFPCTREFHQQFQQKVLDAYQQELSQLSQRQQASQEQAEPPYPEMKM